MKQRVRGILIDSGKITIIKRVKERETYYVFPGGGVEEGENLTQALKREMKEELGVDVLVKELFKKKQFSQPGIKQMEYFYICETVGGRLGTGNGPEYQPGDRYDGRQEIIRIPVLKIEEINLLPLEVRDMVLERNHTQHP